MSASNLFLYCYFGKLATESQNSWCLYETNWQNLPLDLQKYFILMIANVQKPLHYHGFKIAVLDLETFTNVRNRQSCQKLLGSCFVFLLWSFNFSQFLKTVFTYYMMFKTLTEWAKTEVGYKWAENLGKFHCTGVDYTNTALEYIKFQLSIICPMNSRIEIFTNIRFCEPLCNVLHLDDGWDIRLLVQIRINLPVWNNSQKIIEKMKKTNVFFLFMGKKFFQWNHKKCYFNDFN